MTKNAYKQNAAQLIICHYLGKIESAIANPTQPMYWKNGQSVIRTRFSSISALIEQMFLDISSSDDLLNHKDESIFHYNGSPKESITMLKQITEKTEKTDLAYQLLLEQCLGLTDTSNNKMHQKQTKSKKALASMEVHLDFIGEKTYERAYKYLLNQKIIREGEGKEISYIEPELQEKRAIYPILRAAPQIPLNKLDTTNILFFRVSNLYIDSIRNWLNAEFEQQNIDAFCTTMPDLLVIIMNKKDITNEILNILKSNKFKII